MIVCTPQVNLKPLTTAANDDGSQRARGARQVNGHVRQPINRSDSIFLLQLGLLADVYTTEKG